MIIRIIPPPDKDKPKAKVNEKPSRQRGFQNLLFYHAKLGSELVYTENIVGEKPEELAAYFNEVAARSSRVKDPVFNAIISFAYDEREPTPEIMQSIAQHYLKSMGYGSQPWVMYRHTDKKHIHFHLISCRVDIRTGKGISSSFENLRSLVILRVLAPLFGYRVGKEQELIEPVLDQQQDNSIFEQPILIDRDGQIPEELDVAAEINTDEYIMPEGEIIPIPDIEQLPNIAPPSGGSDQDQPLVEDVSVPIAQPHRKSALPQGLVAHINERVQHVLMTRQPYSMYRFIQACADYDLTVKKLPKGYTIKLGNSFPIGLSRLPVFREKRLTYILRENKTFRNREMRYIRWKISQSLYAIRTVWASAKTSATFADRFKMELSQHAISVIYNTNSAGICGVSFEHMGVCFKGSELRMPWEVITQTAQKVVDDYPQGHGKHKSSPAKTKAHSRTLIGGAGVGRRLSEDEEEKKRKQHEQESIDY